MVEYKFYYFNARGLGDVSRQLFALSQTPFEDVRVDYSQWVAFPEQKEKFPFRQLPVLELSNGVMIPQSMAIARYLAKEFGYAGKTEEEAAMADALADQFKDFYVEIKPVYYGKMGVIPTDIDNAKTEVLIPARDKFLGILGKFLKESKSGFLLSGGVTYADLIISDNMRTLIGWWPEYLDGFPLIKEWFQRMESIPEIQQHLKDHADVGF